MDKVRIGYVGLGRRGTGMLKSTFGLMPDVEIVSVCDRIPERMEAAADWLVSKGCPRPRCIADYRELVRDPGIDAVAVMTGWDSHISVSLAALRAGKYTAMEVGTAYDISDCFDLLSAHEETGAPLMMLENCCYGRREMMALRVVKEGLFGRVLHAAGGYHHYLNDSDLFVADKKTGAIDTTHYRATEYLYRNCEQYPTHELGPISKALSLGRGNRMVSLVSVASASCGIEEYMKEKVPADHPYAGRQFRQGDIVDTIITCAGGETITLTLDTTLPRPYYSRELELRGTRGGCIEIDRNRATWYLQGMPEGTYDNEAEFFEKYDHPLHREYVALGSRGGHGGKDWLVVRAFIEAVKNGTDTPIDVYDTLAWLAVGPLSAQSISLGGAPVLFPDFTHGKWERPAAPHTGKYSLDVIVEDRDTPIIPEGTRD